MPAGRPAARGDAYSPTLAAALSVKRLPPRMYAHAKELSDMSDLPEQNPLMTTREVAEVFRRSERTIRDWVRKGWLKPVRVGRSVYFRRADIERLLDQGTAN
jgi:excisionase family DNA binding protein